MVMVHGLGEHSGRYTTLANTFSQEGFCVWAPDLYGHGQSGGPRGDIASFDDYLDAVRAVLHLASRNRENRLPQILLGHSMGGLICLKVALQRPDLIDAVVVSSPLLALNRNVPATQLFLVRCMACLWPGLPLKNGVNAHWLSHDPHQVQAYLNDPAVHDRITARWLNQVIQAMAALHAEGARMVTPILMQVAGADRVVDPDGAKRFFDSLVLPDRKLVIYEGLYHEIYNEREDLRTGVLQDLQNWLTAHLT